MAVSLPPPPQFWRAGSLRPCLWVPPWIPESCCCDVSVPAEWNGLPFAGLPPFTSRNQPWPCLVEPSGNSLPTAFPSHPSWHISLPLSLSPPASLWSCSSHQLLFFKNECGSSWACKKDSCHHWFFFHLHGSQWASSAHSVGCLFLLSMVSFSVHKLFKFN